MKLLCKFLHHKWVKKTPEGTKYKVECERWGKVEIRNVAGNFSKFLKKEKAESFDDKIKKMWVG